MGVPRSASHLAATPEGFSDFYGPAQLFAETAFCEGRADHQRIPRARNDQREKPLADPPANAGEVVQRSARRQIQRRDLRVAVGHQLLRPGNARAKFVRHDGLDAVSERAQRLERFGEFLLGLRRRGRRQQRSCREDCSALEQIAARKSHDVCTLLELPRYPEYRRTATAMGSPTRNMCPIGPVMSNGIEKGLF